MSDRVLMVIMGFHPHVGGAEKQAQTLAVSMIDRGAQVDVLTMRLPGTKKIDNVSGINVLRVGFGSRLVLQVTALIAFFFFVLAKGRRYNVIHVHQALLAAVPTSIAARLINAPLIAKVGNAGDKFDLDVVAKRYPFGPALRKILTRYVDVFVALSNQIRCQLISAGVRADCIESIPNGVCLPEKYDRRHRPDILRELNLNSSNKVLLCSARLVETKNHSFLLDVVATIGRDDVHLVAIGDGPLRFELEDRARRLKIAHQTHFIGNVADVDAYISAADLFVLCSKAEGMSNAIMEAMSWGVPVVASDIPANEFVNKAGGCGGILCSPGDADDWVRTIETLCDDDTLRKSLGREAREIAENHFAMPAVANMYMDLYRKLGSYKR